MTNLLKTSLLKQSIEEFENEDLDMHFEIITRKLRECALHEPGIDLEKDEEISELETQLLCLQEDILEKTSMVKIRNDEDFIMAKKLWHSAIDCQHDADINLPDRLALSLFKYTEAQYTERRS